MPVADGSDFLLSSSSPLHRNLRVSLPPLRNAGKQNRKQNRFAAAPIEFPALAFFLPVFLFFVLNKIPRIVRQTKSLDLSFVRSIAQLLSIAHIRK